ncbi:NAD dependent epimerase/dehydratase family protein [Aeromicrobium marinum DSM 15272]|uniref:NAD dependent epimerase/dehydratase family protein n=1 Tax=Aeromicrobium marinum DSM 15272 TaxID=585531 RepID=E2SC63_9ACTN|nr:NAD-dependent epimerase/dehydratase family protein [Aeromicrobium marinum]EFQ83349.1 NAD dependent epimerase/dehydratase family protein [Aeromicrobium marinum DSM 15272]
MKVLLTGAAGFIGTHIGRIAGERGHDVRRLDLYLEKAHGTGGERDPRVARLDLRSDRLDEIVADVDVVCHQAAMVGNGVDAQDLPDYAEHNDAGTARLLAAMARVGARDLVLASSMVVYGDGRYTCPEHGDVPPATRREDDLSAGRYDPRCPVCAGPIEWRRIDESTPFLPRTSYAASKVAQEHYASAWCTLEDARAIALRYHNVYGPGMPADTPYAGVAAIFRSSIARGEAPRVFEDGRQVRDFVHVHDIALANVLAVEQVSAHRGGLTAYNVASGHPTTIGEMARTLAAAAGAPEPVVTGEYRRFDVRHVVASPDAARDSLGFSAEVRPEDGLAALATDPLRTR